jgi:hypothetical protein
VKETSNQVIKTKVNLFIVYIENEFDYIGNPQQNANSNVKRNPANSCWVETAQQILF